MIEPLESVMDRSTCDKGSKWHNFCKRYAPFLEPLRDKPINLLEVGIQFGCSARMWLEAFPLGHIYGVDIGNEHHITDPRFHFQIGNQASQSFWTGWLFGKPPMNVIVDDASHLVGDSRTQFECLFPKLAPGGLYAIEDVLTHFDPDYHASADMGKWLSELVGSVNWHGKDYGGKPHPAPYQLSEFERTVDSIHFSKHLVIIVKK